MVIQSLAVAVIMLVATMAAQAQDDQLDGQWLAPTLDALERFREDPLCLRCSPASTLTQIPGISSRTARRIVDACRSPSITSIDELSDSICASPEQFLMLTSCTTLQCSCVTVLRSLRVRTRTRSSPRQAATARIDATYAYGIAGISLQRIDEQLLPSAWITASLNTLDLYVGDLAFQSGTGLLLGMAQTLMRRGVDVLPGSTSLLVARPWPSIAFENAPRGAAAMWQSTTLPLTLGAVAWIDRASQETRPRSSIHIGSKLFGIDIHTTLLRDFNRSQSGDAMSLLLNYENKHLHVVSEVRLRVDALEGWHAMVGYGDHRTDLVASVWLYAPTINLEYGTSALGGSQPLNQHGFHIAGYHRFASRVSLAASATLLQRLTRTYLDPLPPNSTTLRADVEARTARSTFVRAQLMHRRSVESQASDDGRVMNVHASMRARVDCEHAMSRTTSIRARIDLGYATADRQSPQHATLIAFMCRTRIASTITLSVQLAQWRSSSYDVAPRISTLSVPGTFDMLVCTGVGRAVHAQMRIALPYGIGISAHLRHEIRSAELATEWTIQAEWQLSRTNQRAKRVSFVHEVLSD